MNLDRRDFFKFVGGSAVGLAFTPVPWTLLNDTLGDDGRRVSAELPAVGAHPEGFAPRGG